MLKNFRKIFNAFLNLGLVAAVFFNGIPAIAEDYPTGTVNVVKTVVNNNGGTKQSSDFTINVVGLSGVPAPGGGDPDTYSSSFPGNASGTPVLLGAGFYEITEVVDLAYEVTYSSECSANTSTLLEGGQERTCIITNSDKPGKLNVVVDVVNDDGGSKSADQFSVNINATPSFTNMPGSASGAEVNISAGSYQVTVSPDSGYAFSYSASCDASITNGQSVTCTITANDIAGSSGGGSGSVPSSNLSVTKTADKAASFASDTIIYTVTVTNSGPDTASSVLVTDLLPSDLTYVTSVASTGSYDSITGEWAVGDLVNAQSETLTLTATVNLNVQNTNIVNSVSVSSAVTDPDSSNNTASASVSITPNSGGGSGGGSSGGGGGSSGGSGIPTPPTSGSGGGSSGSGSNPGDGTTGGQVAGASTFSSISMPTSAEGPQGEVLGAATTLPVTGLPILAYSVLGLVSLVAAVKFGKK